MKRLAIALLCLVAWSLYAADRPNIVWIFGEDMGPELGCYGDTNAITPNIDHLAREGARFTHCFTHAPVCAPSRHGLITGQYPTTTGAHHMRSQLVKTPTMFTEYLRKAGYKIAWPTKAGFGKTDFNFEVPPDAFDIRDDWTKKLPKQPFFAFFNITWTHESQIRETPEKIAEHTAKLKPSEYHDPAKMVVPPYHPDAPEVRRDLANYYDLVTAVDYKVGEVLQALEKQGAATNTIVLFTGDHGRGLPRSKRWVYDSGIHVPLIVRWPGKIKAGEVRDNLVAFIDFAPTMLSVAGVKPWGAETRSSRGKDAQTSRDEKDLSLLTSAATKSLHPPMQGIVFLGPNAQERKYVFAARDRMDETFDRIRAVRDKQYKYIRNFYPELPYSQRIAYMELSPTMQVWRKWYAEGKLVGPQWLFFSKKKPREELYDSESDPDEINNLMDSPWHKEKLNELRAALDNWIKETKDLGEIPETELIKRGLVKDKLSEYEERKKDSWTVPPKSKGSSEEKKDKEPKK